MICNVPISMFSTASGMVTPGLETVLTKGYKLHTTTLMSLYPCFSISFWSDSMVLARIPRNAHIKNSRNSLWIQKIMKFWHTWYKTVILPAWTAGCKVFTLPPNISGAPVISETSLTYDWWKNNITIRLDQLCSIF